MRQLDLFAALQSSTEGIDTEFKSARGGMPGSFWASYAAMANTQGGTIVLGVPDAAQLRTGEDEGRPFVVVNVPLRLITRESGNSEKIYIRHDWQGTVSRTGGYHLDEWLKEAKGSADFQRNILQILQ